MKNIEIQQLLHGYRRGHQLLSGSVKLDPADLDVITHLSDLSGSLISSSEVKPYITAYPLPSKSYYAVAKTWMDETASRAGCVVTHTLLIPIDQWGRLKSPIKLSRLFDCPLRRDNFKKYEAPINYEHFESTDLYQTTVSPIFLQSANEFVVKYFDRGLRPLIWFEEDHAEDIFWRLLEKLWPALRMQFASCTYSLQPRFIKEKSFDLMFAPVSAYSRFRNIPRENLIGQETQSPDINSLTKNQEPWISEWTDEIFGNDKSGTEVIDSKQLWSLLSDDPTAIRKIYYFFRLLDRESQSSMAGVGLMDLIESIAPGENDAHSYKRDIIELALRSASRSTNNEEELKCYYLISERLGHSAFSKMNGQLAAEISSSVAALTSTSPEVALIIGEHLFNAQASTDSPFTGGIIAGLRRLSLDNPKQLFVMCKFPIAASLIVAKAPEIAKYYLRSMRNENSYYLAVDELTSWIASIDDEQVRDHLRMELLPEIKSDAEVLLIEELLKEIHEPRICETLAILFEATNGFANGKIRQIISERLAMLYPESVRRWAELSNVWSKDAALLVASTFSRNYDGFDAMLRTPLSDFYRNSQVVASFLEMISQEQLPSWFREYAKSEANFLVPLLALGEQTSPDVLSVVQKVLREVHEIPIAMESNLLGKINALQDSVVGDSLSALAMKSVIQGFIEGRIDRNVYEMWYSTKWAKRWAAEVSWWNLESLIMGYCSSNQDAWTRGWEWLASAPPSLYQRSPEILSKWINNLITSLRWPWAETITEFWVEILSRMVNVSDSRNRLKMYVNALNFAFNHVNYPVSKLVVESFSKVYNAVVDSSVPSSETSILFSFFDWDKGKELRKKLVNSFLNSNWPPGDLALAANDNALLRKLFKRIMRRSDGEEYIGKILKDLDSRKDNVDSKAYTSLLGLVRNPNFYEPWD